MSAQTKPIQGEIQPPAKRDNPVVVFREQWGKMEPEIKSALPPQIPPERFMRVVQTAVNTNPDLLRADRKSLLAAAMKAAQDGLLPDGRDGAFVVFNGQVQWMPMVGGILKKVRNSGELLSISAHVAYENDRFTYILGDDEKIEHEPTLGERGKPRLVYAIAKTRDGGTYREVMTVEEVEKVRSVSRAKNAGPWTTWWSEMARKTAIRRLSKRLPMSTDLDDLIRADDHLYDMDRSEAAGTATRLFRPVANPLADVIEHDPQPAGGTSAPADPADQGAEEKPTSSAPDTNDDAPDEDDRAAVQGDAAPVDPGPSASTTGNLGVYYVAGSKAAEGGKARRAPKDLDPNEAMEWLSGYDDKRLELDGGNDA